MTLRMLAHRFRQVALHLRAVVREHRARLGLGAPVGAAGDLLLRELRASSRARRAFAAAHPADQEASVRVAVRLRRQGAGDDDQLAALLHDLAKGPVGLVPRILHVLEGSPTSGAARGPWSAARNILRRHAASAPRLAADLGAPEGTIALLDGLAQRESGAAPRTSMRRMSSRIETLHRLDSGAPR